MKPLEKQSTYFTSKHPVSAFERNRFILEGIEDEIKIKGDDANDQDRNKAT